MKRLLLAIAIFGTAAGIGFVSVQRARDQLAVIEACEAAQDGRAARALELTEGRVGPDATGRAAAECRCQAFLRQNQPAACLSLLDPLVDESHAWLPQPGLIQLLLQHRAASGRDTEARTLAAAAARAHPEALVFLEHELALRSAAEPEAEVLADLAGRLPSHGDPAARARVLLAQRHLMRGDAPAAIAVLGATPPPGTGAARGLWFDTLGNAHANHADLAAMRAAFQAWEQAGEPANVVRARYALALSTNSLRDPAFDLLLAFEESLDDPQILADATLAESIAIRWIYTLVAADRANEALALYDALADRVSLEGIDRDEIARADLDRRLAQDPASSRRGTLRFERPRALAGGSLWISPPPGSEPDADYVEHTWSGRAPIEVERERVLAPTRWILRDAEHRVRASGAVYPRPGTTLPVTIAARRGDPGPSASPPRRQPADGRTRVVLLLLDCGDWPITQYLRTRGELPHWDGLLGSGYRAVMDSDPPLTAAALEALVWPGRRSDASLAGTFYRYGVELAGLESVGVNPFEPLGWLLPETADFFEVLGAGELRAANLLLAHGGVRAGRHGITTGPDGRTESLALGASRRALRPEERERFPGLGTGLADTDRHYVETIAAEFDAAEALIEAGELDLLAMRIEPLDILTHAHFGSAVSAGQDDGEGLLFEVYRYIDSRLGRVIPRLDADDFLVVASDHGIRTAMEHDRPALFVVQGPDVPHGRAPGRPDLRGLARVLADLVGVETSWPRTGVAAWTGTHLLARAGERPGDVPTEPRERQRDSLTR